MKKNIIIFALLILSSLFSSCFEKQINPNLYGNWVATLNIKNGMNKSEITNKDEVAFYINVEQKIELNFSEKNFTKKVTQTLKSIENKDNYNIGFTEEEIAKQINNELTIFGEYSIYANKIIFNSISIMLADGSKMDYDYYFDLNPFIGESESSERFEFSNDELKISSTIYKKSN